LQKDEIMCDFEDCQNILEVNNRHHALAELRFKMGHIGEAMTIWADLLKGNIKDDGFPGLAFFVDKLKKYKIIV
jgi:hypothetical protein